MIPKKYDFKKQYKGTTFKGVRLLMTKMVNEVETPLDLSGVLFKMDFKFTEVGKPIKTISNGEGITIVDAPAGIVEIDPFVVKLPANNFLYDLKMIFPDEYEAVYMRGNFNVIQNVTNNGL